MDDTFGTYDQFVCEKIRAYWRLIVTKVCESPWIDEHNVQHDKPRGKTWESLKLVQQKWLLTVLKKYAAELERIYLQYSSFVPGKWKFGHLSQ